MNEHDFTVTINSRKYNGEIHRSWKAKLIEQSDSLLTLVGAFEEEVTHPALGVIRRGTVSFEFYWLDRWFNVFRFHEPDGDFRNFYCNLNMPPKFEHGVLDYVDLDLDVLVAKDFSYQVLDLEEFEANARRYFYPANLRAQVQANLRELIFLIENRIFPFDSFDYRF